MPAHGIRRNALHGCFQDAAPDSWGRSLMARALGSGLTEVDYLSLSDDRTRQGALRLMSRLESGGVKVCPASFSDQVPTVRRHRARMTRLTVRL